MPLCLFVMYDILLGLNKNTRWRIIEETLRRWLTSFKAITISRWE
jgi:predicted nucleic acid-binding OB-fold protein